VDVITVAPGRIATPIWSKAETLDLSVYDRSPWRESMVKLRDEMVHSGATGTPPSVVGGLVARILDARRPRARYFVGKGKARALLAKYVLPPRGMDRMVAKTLGLRPPKPTR
jgi:hypothetical protein